MSDFIEDISENEEFRNKGLALSEEFALLEGRRPRILIGGAVNTSTGSLNKICNTFADMGFDVDIAPKLKALQKLAVHSLENDVDMILICSDMCISSVELLNCQNHVLAYQPDMIMSLFVRDPNCMSILAGRLNQWIIFDAKDSAYFMAYNLLRKLLSRP